jgi:glycine cleavage system aminomethyltransferase T
VTVSEPDVSPLAIQGPKAEDLVAEAGRRWDIGPGAPTACREGDAVQVQRDGRRVDAVLHRRPFL